MIETTFYWESFRLREKLDNVIEDYKSRDQQFENKIKSKAAEAQQLQDNIQELIRTELGKAVND